MSRWAGARRRLGSIRLSLILLALVPGVTLTAVWGMTTVQILSEGLRLRSQTELSRSTGALGTEAMLALQRERKLSAVELATPRTPAAALDEQRAATDAAVAKLTAASGTIADAPERSAASLRTLLTSLRGLKHTRGQVDEPGRSSPEGILARYDRMVDAQIQAFQNLSQVDDGELTAQASPAAAARPRHGEGLEDLVPLPRRVPQTSLAAELRAEAAPADDDPARAPADRPVEFSAEAASASLAGFQRGTHRARDSAAEQ